jgi:hypothetical protein
VGCLKDGVAASKVVPKRGPCPARDALRVRTGWREAADPESKGIVGNLAGYAKRVQAGVPTYLHKSVSLAHRTEKSRMTILKDSAVDTGAATAVPSPPPTTLPMLWPDMRTRLRELEAIKVSVRTGPDSDATARQHARGKLTARERIDLPPMTSRSSRKILFGRSAGDRAGRTSSPARQTGKLVHG